MNTQGTPFTITFVSGAEKKVITVDPLNRDSSGHGEPGSILDLALAHDIEIDHACGGVCACSTCHVVIREGIESCGEASESEEDMLDKAPGVGSRSRLACQACPNGSANLVVEIPSWNRNLVREGN